VIEGVIVKPLKTIADERGAVLKMQESTDPEFAGFGEVYFSTVYPGVVKGWHLHEANVLNYSVWPAPSSWCSSTPRRLAHPSELQELFLNDRDRVLVQIPPGVWNGFKGVGPEESIVCDLTTLPHSEDVTDRHDPRDRGSSTTTGPQGRVSDTVQTSPIDDAELAEATPARVWP